jgi:lipopolysaccharide transport system ATP-binding protein
MSDIAIRVENLSKVYRIGLKEQRHETLMGAFTSWVKSPLRNFRDVRMLSKFDDVSADAKNQKSEIRNQKSANRPSDAPFQLSAFNSQLLSPSDVIWALKDVSFEVKQGEAIGIIGRNGAGKSTLLRILARITEPTSGRAEVYGRVGSLLEVGTGFHPDLTGRENVYLNGTILGMKKREIDNKFDEIVEFSGVEKFIDTPVKRYSSGMRIRLAFSVAAHLEPEILIIDEVLAVGDAEFQKKCLGKMGDVAESGRTVLFVSHNLTAVQSLCHRAIWLNDGLTRMDDVPSKVVTAYIQSGERLATERRWPDPDSSPGNSEVRLLGARVCSSDPLELLSLKSPVWLEFDVLNLVPDAVLNLSYHLYSQDGVMVLNSFSMPQALPKGAFKFTCYIPENLLNDGIHSVELMIVKDAANVPMKMPDCLTFQIHDLERQSAWFGKFPGAVRPKMKWTVEDVIT